MFVERERMVCCQVVLVFELMILFSFGDQVFRSNYWVPFARG